MLDVTNCSPDDLLDATQKQTELAFKHAEGDGTRALVHATLAQTYATLWAGLTNRVQLQEIDNTLESR